MYSFRRGGATWLPGTFLKPGTDAVTWTLGFYINGTHLPARCRSSLSHLSIKPEQKQYMHSLAQVLSATGQKGVRGR